tara:strand:- start:233 stop:448 length:216 start_codon:yes stop_codon:yes gene_type:complete
MTIQLTYLKLFKRMDLIPGVVLFIGVIATVGFLGLDTFQNRKPITKAEIQQTRISKPTNQKQKRRGLFNRG